MTVTCTCVLYVYTYILIQVNLDPNSGIFITLNPAGKGYGGRQKLPDNLNQLFRPVAMSRPDNELIAEVILFAEGFKTAKSLGRKLVSVFSLARYGREEREKRKGGREEEGRVEGKRERREGSVSSS